MRLWDFNEEETAQALEKYNILTDKQTADLGVAPLIKRAFAGEAVVLPAIEYAVSRTTADIGLEHIKGLHSLTTLRLDGTQVTDAGLEHLKEMAGLRQLSLLNTEVSDAGLLHLEGLAEFQNINADPENTKVTDEGLKKLQQALPNCRINMAF